MPATSYKPELVEQADKLCRYLGATVEDLAKFFDVHRDTIFEWMRVHPEFKAAVDSGRMEADTNVAEKLYQRATGYKHPDVHISNYMGEITITDIEKEYPPDPVACIFWLTNRQRHLWRRKPTEESHADIDRKIKEVTYDIKKVELKNAEKGGGAGEIANALAALIEKLPS